MVATSSRTLRLLSLLQTHRYWPGGQLADRLEISPRTLRRDIDRLRNLGYPVLANRGVDGGYQLEAGATLPPLLLDDEEAVGLAVALQTAAQESVTGVAESSLRALAKLTQVMPPRLRHRVEALRAATEMPEMPGWTSGGTMTTADPRLHQRQPEGRKVVLRQLRLRRHPHRQGHVHEAGPDRRLRRLEHCVEQVEGRQRSSLTGQVRPLV